MCSHLLSLFQDSTGTPHYIYLQYLCRGFLTVLSLLYIFSVFDWPWQFSRQWVRWLSERSLVSDCLTFFSHDSAGGFGKKREVKEKLPTLHVTYCNWCQPSAPKRGNIYAFFSARFWCLFCGAQFGRKPLSSVLA